jgi:hypothetical protein
MIDFDLDLARMLEAIDWRPAFDRVALDDLSDVRSYTLPACRISASWRMADYNIDVLADLYLKRFSQIPFHEVYDDLLMPVKRGIGNAMKWGNQRDEEKLVRLDHYFTGRGLAVSITDEGDGFDYKNTLRLLEDGKKYFTAFGEGFKRFRTCKSTISYMNSGRTLLIGYPFESPDGNPWVPITTPADRVLTTRDMRAAFPKRLPYTLLGQLSLFGPQFLHRLWSDRTFVERHIRNHLPIPTEPDECGQFEVAEDLVQITTRAVTVRYGTAGETVFAKFYRQPKLSDLVYDVMTALRDRAFGDGEAYRVPDCLGYVPEHRMVIARRARGVPLQVSLTRMEGDLAANCRRVAHWLAGLHGSAHRMGLRHDGPTEMLQAVAKGFAGHHEAAKKPLTSLVNVLAERAGQADANRVPAVQSHGDFVPRNAFIADDAVTLIGLDHACVADPALDLARFMNSVWRQVAHNGGDAAVAESLITEFLDAYAARHPENLANLPFYWGYFAIRSLTQYTRYTRRLMSRGLFDGVVRLHRAEFELAARKIDKVH